MSRGLILLVPVIACVNCKRKKEEVLFSLTFEQCGITECCESPDDARSGLLVCTCLPDDREQVFSQQWKRHAQCVRMCACSRARYRGVGVSVAPVRRLLWQNRLLSHRLSHWLGLVLLRQGEYGSQLTNLSALQSALSSAMLHAAPPSLAAARRMCSAPAPTHLPTLILCHAEVRRLSALPVNLISAMHLGSAAKCGGGGGGHGVCLQRQETQPEARKCGSRVPLRLK